MSALALTAAWKFLSSKVVGVSALALSVALGVTVGIDTLKIKAVERDRATLTARIDDPKTGYVARLSQADANVAELQSDLDRLNVAIEQQSALSQATIATLTANVTTANRQSVLSAARVATLLASPPAGASACERALDADKRVLESLK